MIFCSRMLKITRLWQTWKKSPWHFGLAVKPNIATSRILPHPGGLKGPLEKHLLSEAGLGWACCYTQPGVSLLISQSTKVISVASCALPDNI